MYAKSIIIYIKIKKEKKINFLDRMVTPIASWYNYVNYYSKNTGIHLVI